MEIFEKLPIELKRKVCLYFSHPIADLIKNIDYEAEFNRSVNIHLIRIKDKDKDFFDEYLYNSYLKHNVFGREINVSLSVCDALYCDDLYCDNCVLGIKVITRLSYYNNYYNNYNINSYIF